MWDELLKPGATSAPIAVEYLAIGLGLVIATVVGRLKLGQGSRAKAPAGPVAEIAGAVITDAKADELIAAMQRLEAAVVSATSGSKLLRAAVGGLAGKLDRNSDMTKTVADTIDEARQDLRDLERALIRRQE